MKKYTYSLYMIGNKDMRHLIYRDLKYKLGIYNSNMNIVCYVVYTTTCVSMTIIEITCNSIC